MYKYLQYSLQPGGFVNRFLRLGIFCREESFTPSVLKGRVNEWLKKGFSIHENPCRREFIAKRMKSPPAYRELSEMLPGDMAQEFGQTLPAEIYFPFGNNHVDASAFYSSPTYLRSYHTAELVSGHGFTGEFLLETCGAATVWADEELICDFAPFTRNLCKSLSIKIPLKAGRTRITVCLDDLAERDTDYYFGLRYLGGPPLTIALPVSEEAEPARINELEAFMGGLYLPGEVIIDKPLVLEDGTAAPFDTELSVLCIPAIGGEVAVRDNSLLNFTVPVKEGQREIPLPGSEGLPPDFYYLQISASVCGITPICKLGIQVFSKALLDNSEPDIGKRREAMLRFFADTGSNSAFRAAALLYFDEEKALREEIILTELEGIRRRRDCSDFYFVVILYLLKRYPDKISLPVQKAIRETALGFRYWIDEPGDDVMWFFSENHALLFHICQYFAGVLFPSALFVNSGLTGTEQREKAKGLLADWFSSFFEEFVTEWNSSAYIPVDALGFAALYNFEASGSRLKAAAERALDMIFRCIALNSYAGVNTVSFGRSYEEHLRGRYVVGTTGLLYLGYGRGYMNRCGMGYALLAMGDYAPPQKYEQLIESPKGHAMVFQNTQGYENHVDLYLYKTHDGILSSAINFKPFTPGYQECIVQAALSPTAQAFINHPGEAQPYGKGRPSYWAGNGSLPRVSQYLGTALIHYELDKNSLIDYTHAYLPLDAFDEYIAAENYIALRLADGYIGIMAQNGLQLQTDGPFCGREIISPGCSNVWLLELAGTEKYSTLAEFSRYLAGISIVTSACGTVSLSGSRYCSFVAEPSGDLLVNGRSMYSYPLRAEGLTVWCPAAK